MRYFINRHRIIHGIILIAMLFAIYRLVTAGIRHSPASPITHREVFHATDRYWEKAKEADYLSIPELLTQHRSALENGVKYDILIDGSKTRKEIALTFDDGPHPVFTREILAILDKYDVKATFFLVGEMAELHPELVRAEIADGHNIGNHTYHHVNLTRIPDGYIATEVTACDEVLQGITGRKVNLFRPPGGDYNISVAEVCELLKHTMILWTDDPADYARPGADVIKQRILKRARNGGIILIHDGIQQTIDVLPDILRTLKDRGYKFVTIDEMLHEKGKS